MERRFKRLRRLGTVVAVIVTVVGLAGIGDDLQTWQGWLAKFGGALSGDLGRWVLVASGLALLVLVNEDKLRARFRKK